MSLRKTLTTGIVSAALVAANITPFATAAEAEGWRGHRPGHGFYRSERHDWDGGPRYSYRHGGYRKDKSDKNIARGLAIGLGVLMLGAILSAEAERHQDRYNGY